MRNNNETSRRKVIDYFSSWESRWGYTLLLKGIKHFGYYPEGRENLSMYKAQRLMEDKLAEMLNLDGGSLVLDAGCGEGGVAIYLAKKYRLRIEGVDLLESSIEKANKKSLELGLQDKVDFQVMDYTKLDFPNESFDGAYTMESLVHVLDYQQALREFYRALKPNGKLVLFEYSVCSEDDATVTPRQMNLAKMVAEESGMYALPHFLHGRFPKIVKEAGFTDISVEDITPRIMPMLRKFYLIAYLPYRLIKLFGLQRKFINATTAAEGYKVLKESGIWRYNIVTAVKPK